MQSLWLASTRRLRLPLSASVARPPLNSLSFALFHRTRSFAPAPRWNSSTSQPPHQTFEGDERSKPGEVEMNSSQAEASNENATLVVRNIPFSTTQEDLRGVFSSYGSVRGVEIGRRNDGSSQGWARIEFGSTLDAKKVTSDHQKRPITIGDREIRIPGVTPQSRERRPAWSQRAAKERFPPGPIIFIGGLHPKATEEDVIKAMEGYGFGDVVSVRIGTDQYGTPRMYAHITFASVDEAEGILEHYRHHPIHILDQEVRLDRAQSRWEVHPPSPRLHFVGWEGDRPSLRSHFRALGSKIVDLHFIRKTDPGITTMSGFVEFCDLRTAEEALTRFNTSKLTLTYSRPSSPAERRWQDKKPANSGFGLNERRRLDRVDE